MSAHTEKVVVTFEIPAEWIERLSKGIGEVVVSDPNVIGGGGWNPKRDDRDDDRPTRYRDEDRPTRDDRGRDDRDDDRPTRDDRGRDDRDDDRPTRDDRGRDDRDDRPSRDDSKSIPDVRREDKPTIKNAKAAFAMLSDLDRQEAEDLLSYFRVASVHEVRKGDMDDKDGKNGFWNELWLTIERVTKR